jgi:hypothetical protein
MGLEMIPEWLEPISFYLCFVVEELRLVAEPVVVGVEPAEVAVEVEVELAIHLPLEVFGLRIVAYQEREHVMVVLEKH